VVPVGDAVVDLIGNETYPVFGTPGGKLTHIVTAHHGAGRVIRGGKNETIERLPRMQFGQLVHVELEVRVHTDRDVHDLYIKCSQNVAVGGVSGSCQSHSIADVEGRQEACDERARGTGHHGDGFVIHVEIIPSAVVTRDRFAEFFGPQ